MLFAFFSLVFLLFIVNVVWRAVSFIDFLTTPLSPKLEGIGKGLLWKQSGTITVACVCEPVVIASFEPQQKKINLVFLPSDLYLEVPRYGLYPASSAYGLGQLAKQPQGGKLFSSSLSLAVRGPIDYYLKFNDEAFNHPTEEKISELAKKLNSFDGLLLFLKSFSWIKKNLETNLTLFDIYRLWWSIKNVGISKVNFLSLPQSYFEDLVLPDGQKVKMLTEQGLGEYSAAFFSDQKILNEKVSIEILNATSRQKIAEKIAKIIEASGADVVFTGNAPSTAKQTILEASDKVKNSVTTRRIARFLNLKVQDKKEENLADVTLIVGEDQVDFFNVQAGD